MINSLSKDSHITQSFCLPLQGNARQRQNQKLGRVATVNSHIGTGINKPTGISFGGLAGAKLAHDDSFKNFIKGVKSFIGEKANLGNTKKLINQSIAAIEKPSGKIDKKVEEFLKTNRETVQGYIEQFNKLVDKDVKPKYFKEERDDIVDAAIDGVFGLELKSKKFYESERVKKFLEFATDKKIVFSAFFALLLTCIVRPLTIMAMPGDKKNNDDKKYASAHSVASGLIGYVLALGIFGPISTGVNKIVDKAGKKGDFLGEKTKYLLENNKKPLYAAKTYLSMLPDTILSPPKAILTIGLIPVILKTFFGLEKKKKSDKSVGTPISDNLAAINLNKAQNNGKTKQVVSGGVK